jgi:hypothetical protein
MDAVPIKPERKAQLDDYAQRYSQNVTDALDEALGAYLEWERTDYREAVEGTWLRQRRNPNATRKVFLSGCIPSMQAIPAFGGFWRWKTRLRRWRPCRPVVRWLRKMPIFPYEVRHLLYGHKPHVYRILFTIRGDTVSILYIRHGRRQSMSAH